MGNLPVARENNRETVETEVIDDELEKLTKESEQLSNMSVIKNRQVAILNQVTRNVEHANRRYWEAEAGRQGIVQNEQFKFYILSTNQNNLLNRINIPEIRFWRYGKKLYYRDNLGNLIYGDESYIERELSSRYGVNVVIVNDLNDVLRNMYEIKTNTTFIAINNIVVVEEEKFEPYTSFELFQESSTWKRNLLAYTRYIKKRIYIGSNYTSSFTQEVMPQITENKSIFISKWIKDIGSNNDNILLLVGNQSVSEDLIVNKVIKSLFDTNIVVPITDDMLSKDYDLAKAVDKKLFLHINQIPTDPIKQKKLKDLIVSVIINKRIESNGGFVPTQAKIIVTIDEPNQFFKDYMEISTILFINSMDKILEELAISSSVGLYQHIESSLDYFSGEIECLYDYQNYSNENQKYFDLIQDKIQIEEIVSDTGLPILDPYSDTFETLLPQGEYHTHITGQTRIGKSLLLVTLFVWYMRNNNCSIVLFDVHGDLAKKVKMLVKDTNRLLYISNSLDKKYAATINLFEISDKSETNISRMANVILNVIKQIKTDESFTGNMEEALLRGIRVLLRKGNGSFSELYRLMNDKKNTDLIEYAKKCGNSMDEEYFTDYFNDTNTKNAIRRRLSTLLDDEDFVNLTHGTSKIDFAKEINTPGKIIVIDIAKGDMDSYIYYIRFIIEYILVLALQRVNTPKEQRTKTHLILDEFDNFITSGDNIKTILKEAGKYNLFLTMAHQIISDIKDSSLRDTILGMTETKIICRNSNKTLEAIEKTHNIKLDAENLNKGEQYIVNGNNVVTKSKNTDRFLDEIEEMSPEEWDKVKDSLLNRYYRPITNKTSSQQPTEDDLKKMIQQFKNDIHSILSSQLSIESSSLNNLHDIAQERFDEIKSDVDYFDSNKGIKRPRIRQQEISTIFQFAFELNEPVVNRKFISLLKSENQDDMFNQTDSGTRSADFTDNGKTQTEQYYYLEW